MRSEEPTPRPPLTPMIDIAFLVLIFFLSLPLRRLDGKLSAHLPKESGIRQHRAEPVDPVRIALRRRGDATRYHLGTNVFASARGLEPLLRRLGPTYDYEVGADDDVPWADVVRAVDVVRGLRYDVRFRGGRTPPPEVRRLLRLPAPSGR